MSSPAITSSVFLVPILFTFFLSLSAAVSSAEEKFLGTAGGYGKGYTKGDLIPVSCLNRTVGDGQHISDSLGNLQYIPFPTCNETGLPLAFAYDIPAKVVCTIEYLEDGLYHLLEYFVHSDVPLTCRVPSYPLHNVAPAMDSSSSPPSSTVAEAASSIAWTPLTIALQGTFQLSHLHLHTSINVLFHTTTSTTENPLPASHLIGATAYSLPNLTAGATSSTGEGSKVMRTKPLTLTFNAGWIDGDALPGMVGGRPMVGVTDHGLGFTLLSFSALAASAGLGAMAMMMWERKRNRRSHSLSLNGGLSPSDTREMGMNGNATGYSGYGGYGRYSGSGKRD